MRRLAAAKLANEPAGHTLDATALVHGAFLRVGGGTAGDRGEFFKAAALAMQRILVDHARRKRAGRCRRFAIAEVDRIVPPCPDTLLDVDEALSRLTAEDPSSEKFRCRRETPRTRITPIRV